MVSDTVFDLQCLHVQIALQQLKGKIYKTCDKHVRISDQISDKFTSSCNINICVVAQGADWIIEASARY